MNYIDKVPNWLRWILVPIASIIAGVLITVMGRIFFWLQAKMSGIGEGAWLDLIWTSVFVGGVTGFGLIYAGAHIAPSGKKMVALCLGALWIMAGGTSIYLSILKSNWWEVVEIVSTIVGIGSAIYVVFDGKGDFSPN